METLHNALMALNAGGLLAVAFAAGRLWMRVDQIDKWIDRHDEALQASNEILQEVRITNARIEEKLDDLTERVDRMSRRVGASPGA